MGQPIRDGNFGGAEKRYVVPPHFARGARGVLGLQVGRDGEYDAYDVIGFEVVCLNHPGKEFPRGGANEIRRIMVDRDRAANSDRSWFRQQVCP